MASLETVATSYRKYTSYSTDVIWASFVSNHWNLHYLFNAFRLTTNKTKVPHYWSGFARLSIGNLSGPSQRASNAESVSKSWHYHVNPDSTIHGANMGPAGTRWAPCWPHELCYQGSYLSFVFFLVGTITTVSDTTNIARIQRQALPKRQSYPLNFGPPYAAPSPYDPHQQSAYPPPYSWGSTYQPARPPQYPPGTYPGQVIPQHPSPHPQQMAQHPQPMTSQPPQMTPQPSPHPHTAPPPYPGTPDAPALPTKNPNATP